jgi:hypothetical protein
MRANQTGGRDVERMSLKSIKVDWGVSMRFIAQRSGTRFAHVGQNSGLEGVLMHWTHDMRACLTHVAKS